MPVRAGLPPNPEQDQRRAAGGATCLLSPHSHVSGRPGHLDRWDPRSWRSAQVLPAPRATLHQGPVVGAASPACPLPLRSPFRPVSSLRVRRGQRREGGPWTPRHRVRPHWGREGRVRGPRASSSGLDLSPSLATTSVLFQGQPGLQGTRGRLAFRDRRWEEKPGWRVRGGGSGASFSAPPFSAWPGQWGEGSVCPILTGALGVVTARGEGWA